MSHSKDPSLTLPDSEPQTPLPMGYIPLLSKRDWIVEKVAGKSVLHVGPTDHPDAVIRARQGRLLHLHLQKHCKELVGVDLAQSSIDALREQFGITDIIYGNAEALETIFPDKQFDVIVAGDVIEHMSNVGNFFVSARKVLKPGGELIVTTPNSFAIKRMLGAIFLRQERNNPDHLYFFSLMTLWQVAWRFGFQISEAGTFMYEAAGDKLNRRGNAVAKFIMKLTSNNFLADELAVSMKLARNR